MRRRSSTPAREFAERPHRPGRAGAGREDPGRVLRLRGAAPAARRLHRARGPHAGRSRPYDKASMGAIEKAIRSSDLGLNPSNDGHIIRLSFPPLTAERRKELVKLVKHMAEEGRIARAQRCAGPAATSSRRSRRTATSPRTSCSGPRRSSTSSPTPRRPRSTRRSSTRSRSCSRTEQRRAAAARRGGLRGDRRARYDPTTTDRPKRPHRGRAHHRRRRGGRGARARRRRRRAAATTSRATATARRRRRPGPARAALPARTPMPADPRRASSGPPVEPAAGPGDRAGRALPALDRARRPGRCPQVLIDEDRRDPRRATTTSTPGRRSPTSAPAVARRRRRLGRRRLRRVGCATRARGRSAPSSDPERAAEPRRVPHVRRPRGATLEARRGGAFTGEPGDEYDDRGRWAASHEGDPAWADEPATRAGRRGLVADRHLPRRPKRSPTTTRSVRATSGYGDDGRPVRAGTAPPAASRTRQRRGGAPVAPDGGAGGPPRHADRGRRRRRAGRRRHRGHADRLRGPAMLVATVVIVLAAVEFFNVVRRAGFQPRRLVGLVAMRRAAARRLLAGHRGLPARDRPRRSSCAVLLVPRRRRRRAPTGGREHRASPCSASLWIGGLGSFAALMLRGPRRRRAFLLSADRRHRRLRRRRPVRSAAAPGHTPLVRASPNKTVEGLVGGMVGALVVTLIARRRPRHRAVRHARRRRSCSASPPPSPRRSATCASRCSSATSASRTWARSPGPRRRARPLRRHAVRAARCVSTTLRGRSSVGNARAAGSAGP